VKGAALAGAALALSLALSAVGCAPSGYYRSTSSSLDSLLTLQAQQQRRIAALEREIAGTREQVQASRASSDSRLGELSQRMDMLQGKLEESGARFTQLSQKVETVKARISSSDSVRSAAAVMDPDQAYHAASSDFANGRYGLAKDAFTSYVQRYPDTVVSDDAQFKIGECAFLTGDFNGAIEAYKKVVEKYPDGDRVPGALYKTGVAYARLSNMEEARKYYRTVITRYPKSSEAAAAREAMAPAKKRAG